MRSLSSMKDFEIFFSFCSVQTSPLFRISRETVDNVTLERPSLTPELLKQL